MTSNSDNRKRAFADVVTIDAWHDRFSEEHARVDLHADVVFGTARVGGDTESPVRFRLNIRRADIVIVIPESEPLTVDRKSVSRDTPELEGRLTQVIQQSTQANLKAGASLSVTPVKPAASARIDSDAQVSRAASEKLEVSGTIRFLAVTQSKTADGHYRWQVESRKDSHLEGRPWDALKQPRLTLIDQRKDRNKGIPPTVRVEVRCRREDLRISDLEIKDEGLWDTVRRRVGFKNKLAAAESYIRDYLSQEGLEVKNIEDIFGTVTIASATAESS